MTFDAWDKANPPKALVTVALACEEITDDLRESLTDERRLSWLACEEEHKGEVERRPSANDPRMRDADLPLDERIDRAIKRITTGMGAMRIPVEATDPDVVLSNCKDELATLRARFAAVEKLEAACREEHGGKQCCGDHEEDQARG